MANDALVPKKPRGPKPTGKGTPVMLRLQPALLARVDAVGAKSRPEAIRQILEVALPPKEDANG